MFLGENGFEAVICYKVLIKFLWWIVVCVVAVFRRGIRVAPAVAIAVVFRWFDYIFCILI
jgi:hypothetical protein